MKFGINTQVWTFPFTSQDIPLVERVKGMGGSVLEASYSGNPPGFDVAALRAAARDAGVEVALCGFLGPERDISSTSRSVRQAGIDYFKGGVEILHQLGGTIFCGPLYAELFRTRWLPEGERQAERRRSVESLQQVGELAAAAGVIIALEPLNRFETDFPNTAAGMIALLEEVNSPNVRLHLDTFHMHIEEKDSAAAIRQAGDWLAHFHTCENDRGTPGTGQVHWDAVFAALRDIGYDGQVVIEGFNPAVVDLVNGARIWRRLAPTQDAIAAEGLRFLQGALA